ncbi:MAG: diacylglycerol kinase family protein [bacterium]
MRVFLNPHCNYGMSRTRWQKIEKELYQRIGDFNLEEIHSIDGFPEQVAKAIKNEARILISAGGDGSVHLLLNAIMNLQAQKNILIGAVGLGSSNDFHKPFRDEAYIKDVPVRIDWENAKPCDVIRIDYQDDQGVFQSRFSLLNASIGLTAQANALFNSQPLFLKIIRNVSVDAAIIACALKTILSYRHIPCLLTVDNQIEQEFLVTNLGIIKSPHFAGSLCYDIVPDNGLLGVNLCFGMSLFERIGILMALARHRFQGYPKTHSWFSRQVLVNSKQVFALEMDGEVVMAQRVRFSLIPEAVRCCQ